MTRTCSPRLPCRTCQLERDSTSGRGLVSHATIGRMIENASTNGIPTPTDRWIDRDGVRLHALDWGGPDDGTLVLLLHGVGGNAWIWDDVAQRLRASLPRHRIVGLDQRDGGDTDHPAAGYGRDDFAADAFAVADAYGGRPFVLVGHSRAGWLAASIAISHPERLDRAVLVDPARLMFATESDADGYYGTIRDGLGPFPSADDAVAWARAGEPDADWSETRIRSFLFGYREDAEGRFVSKLPPEVVPLLRAAREASGEVGEGLARITVPTLLLVGTSQPAVRVGHRRAYQERIPGVVVRDIPATHFVHTDQPEMVAEAIAEFISD